MFVFGESFSVTKKVLAPGHNFYIHFLIKRRRESFLLFVSSVNLQKSTSKGGARGNNPEKNAC